MFNILFYGQIVLFFAKVFDFIDVSWGIVLVPFWILLFIFVILIIDMNNFANEAMSKGWSKQKTYDEYMKKFKKRYLNDK